MDVSRLEESGLQQSVKMIGAFLKRIHSFTHTMKSIHTLLVCSSSSVVVNIMSKILNVNDC